MGTTSDDKSFREVWFKVGSTAAQLVQNPNPLATGLHHGTFVAGMTGGFRHGVAKNTTLIDLKVWHNNSTMNSILKNFAKLGVTVVVAAGDNKVIIKGQCLPGKREVISASTIDRPCNAATFGDISLGTTVWAAGVNVRSVLPAAVQNRLGRNT